VTTKIQELLQKCKDGKRLSGVDRMLLVNMGYATYRLDSYNEARQTYDQIEITPKGRRAL